MPIKNSIGQGFAISGGGGGDMFKSTYDPTDTGIWQVAHGGTGATNAADARTNLGAQEQFDNLNEISALGGSTGLLARDVDGNFNVRTISSGDAYVTVSNGNGVSGNPTIDLQNTLTTDSVQTVSGEKTFSNASGIKANTIIESTSTNGISIDSVKFKDGFIEMDEQSDPSTPSSGKIIVYAKSASVGRIQTKNSSGVVATTGYDTKAISVMNSCRNQWQILPGAGSPAGTYITPSISLLNSGTGASTGSAASACGKYNTIVTGATSSNYRSYVSNVISSLELLPIFSFVFSTSGATNMRVLMALKEGSGSPWGVDTLADEAIGFQFSTNRGDTNLMAIASNGTTQTSTSTGVSTSYFDTVAECVWGVVVVNSTSSVSYYVFNSSGTQLGSTVTITTNLPTSTTNLRSFFGVQTLAASAATISFYGHIGQNNAYGLVNFP